MEGNPTLSGLLRLLLKHAAFTVGGGSVTTIALERDIVDDLHWLSKDRFRALFGLARVTPGTNILALVTGIGWDFYRWPGALLGLACAAIPGAVLAALLAAGRGRWAEALRHYETALSIGGGDEIELKLGRIN